MRAPSSNRLSRAPDGSLARFDFAGLVALVVEPDEDSRGELQAALVEIGFVKPIGVPTANRAIEMAGKIPPDILLCDVSLDYPDGWDGLQFLQEIREDSTPVPVEIPVLMFAGEAGSFSVMEAKRLGIDGYLAKPVPLKRLEMSLKRILTKRFAERVTRPT